MWGWLAGPLSITYIGPLVSFFPIILMGPVRAGDGLRGLLRLRCGRTTSTPATRTTPSAPGHRQRTRRHRGRDHHDLGVRGVHPRRLADHQADRHRAGVRRVRRRVPRADDAGTRRPRAAGQARMVDPANVDQRYPASTSRASPSSSTSSRRSGTRPTPASPCGPSSCSWSPARARSRSTCGSRPHRMDRRARRPALAFGPRLDARRLAQARRGSARRPRLRAARGERRGPQEGTRRTGLQPRRERAHRPSYLRSVLVAQSSAPGGPPTRWSRRSTIEAWLESHSAQGQPRTETRLRGWAARRARARSTPSSSPSVRPRRSTPSWSSCKTRTRAYGSVEMSWFSGVCHEIVGASRRDGPPRRPADRRGVR